MQWAERRYGNTFKLELPGFQLVMTSEREAVRTMFAAKPDDMHAGKFNFILRPLVGSSSLLLLDGSSHMHRRKLLLPSFHGERMRLYGSTMAEITRRTVRSWSVGDAFPLHRHTQDITLQVILRTVFGADEGSLGELDAQLKRLIKGIESPSAFLQLIYLAQHPEAEQRQPWKWLLRHRSITDAMLYRLIERGRNDASRSGRKDVLAMLLAARDEQGEGLSDVDLRDELMTALAAGHETTATTLAWAMERLLSTPVAYARLREEVRGLGAEPDPEQLAALPYLDATIKEVLRLRPVVPIVGRVLARAQRIAGFDLPEGTPLAASAYLAQRNPEVYPEPDAFRPERFLGVQPDPTAWFPFGGGLRRCIGFAFAMYEMKIVLGTLLASCELELVERAPLRVVRRAVTFSPEGGVRVRVLERAA